MENDMDGETPRYVYTHIEPDEFRLLKIVGVHPQIKFSLEIFSIYEAPEYEALSYAWGTAPETEDSSCNGAQFRISRTLGQALRGIYSYSGEGWIWVDAICINQTDAVEKAHQVAGMGELYSCAEQVLIWLGEAADQSDLACALLPELTEKIWALKESERGWRPLSTDDIVSEGFPHPDDSLWRAVFLLYSRAWFQRLWIVQEVVLARECVFLCGTAQIDWAVIVNFAIATSKSIFVGNIAGLHIKTMGDDLVSRSTNGIRLIRNARRLKAGLEETEKENDGLQGTMDIMQSQGASVKVDYVYAVRDMVPEALREKMVVDYSDEVKNNYGVVHAKFFRQCLERINDWPSMRFPPNVARGATPSWCPPWGSGWNYAYLPVIGYRAGRPAGTTTASSPSGLSLMANDDDDTVLHIAGISVDRVQEIVPLSLVFDNNSTVLQVHRILQAIQDCSSYIPDSANAQKRLLGVLIGQCDWLDSAQFSKRPDGNVLDGLVGFLDQLSINEENRNEADSVPVNLDTAEYFLDLHQFWRGYLNLIMIRWPGRSFALTTNGRMAMVPCETSPGDTVCVFLGGTLPQVVSRQKDGVHWQYVGPSVVDGIMEGEIFDVKEGWVHKREIFRLV
ncbi:heterokaryon incompatibility protein-domain-containing protein [Aspergillus bertholletiae]|uniref:Heterokaryon incompatibility protein-domain-containing protein n=1 Tax=Aspergillus bertholletiae TaxID=1226010 RepID=A0A5N7AR06_9EURO|nr:heterokaryon incompatibility protein-domain-containing protein [Aspergillus bertholletiae]